MELEELNRHLRNDAIKDTGLSKNRLLNKKVSGPVHSLHPGGCGLNAIQMPEAGKGLLLRVQGEMFQIGNLRYIPVVAIAKVLAMRVTKEDKFHIENFGFLMFRDRRRGHKTDVMKTPTKDVSVRLVGKMVRTMILTISDLENAIEGFIMIAERFLNEEIFSGVCGISTRTHRLLWILKDLTYYGSTSDTYGR